MKIGWLADDTSHTGGAELTQAEFRAAAPKGVEIVDCPPGGVMPGLERYVVHNCVKYTTKDFQNVTGPGVKFWHDVGPFITPEVRAILAPMRQICCSPIQADYMEIAGKARCIPPPVDLDEFRRAGDASEHRKGAVSVGSWRNHGKAPHKAAEWAAGNGGIDFFGGGVFAPAGSVEVTYDAMPELLAGYKTFVFLPTVIEPFGRLVVEAWAAGCEIVTNRLVGARWWIEEDPARLETAAEDFWREVLR
jgi:hypothetical protein